MLFNLVVPSSWLSKRDHTEMRTSAVYRFRQHPLARRPTPGQEIIRALQTALSAARTGRSGAEILSFVELLISTKQELKFSQIWMSESRLSHQIDRQLLQGMNISGIQVLIRFH